MLKQRQTLDTGPKPRLWPWIAVTVLLAAGAAIAATYVIVQGIGPLP